MRVLRAAPRSLADALGLAPAMLARAEQDRIPWIAASVVRGPAVALGAAQRAGRVVHLAACAREGVPVLRRATSGTAVHVGERAIVWTLALPHVAAIAPDATPRTLLNRNVRGFLQGLSRVGVPAQYFGREWVSARKRPFAVVGFEVTPGGALVIELVAGVDAPPALPPSLSTEDERSIDRWLGKAPVALVDLSAKDALEVAHEVMSAVARLGGTPTQGALADVEPARAIAHDDDPMPRGFEPCALRRAPIGWIDAGVDRARGRVWLGGDVLAPSHVLRALAQGVTDVGAAPIDGVSMGDLVEAARLAESLLQERPC